MKALHLTTWTLIIIGGLNWLLVGLFQKDLFMMLGMSMSDMLPKIVYILVGLSAVFEIFNHKNTCRHCNPGADMAKPTM